MNEYVSIHSFASHNKFSTKSIDDALVVLHAFRVMRNCASHRAGLASRALEQICSGENAELSEALARLPKRAGTELPRLPVVKYGEPIRLGANHVILMADMTFRVFRELDRQAVEMLSEGGMLRMAARFALLDPDIEAADLASSASSTVSKALMSRYRVDHSAGRQMASLLKKAGMWTQCHKAFGEKTGNYRIDR